MRLWNKIILLNKQRCHISADHKIFRAGVLHLYNADITARNISWDMKTVLLYLLILFVYIFGYIWLAAFSFRHLFMITSGSLWSTLKRNRSAFSVVRDNPAVPMQIYPSCSQLHAPQRDVFALRQPHKVRLQLKQLIVPEVEDFYTCQAIPHKQPPASVIFLSISYYLFWWSQTYMCRWMQSASPWSLWKHWKDILNSGVQ